MKPLVRGIEERDGRWVRLVLDAPRGNLLSLAMVRAIGTALDRVVERQGLRWLTVEGAGGEFSFGAKIQEHLPDPIRRVLPETHALVRRWLSLPVPTAALVEGRCLGGGFELALCCDDILASPRAVFGLPEVRIGAFPPAAALLLPLKVGSARAARAIVTGGFQDASYWHEAGLLSVAAPGRSLLEVAAEWFDARLAELSAVALRHAAMASRAAVVAQIEALLPGLERAYLEELLRSDDAVEGVRAWMDRRSPVWKDE
jgi:cyclohexa-1,5-dienecarbonyl-CoA hydratase